MTGLFYLLKVYTGALTYGAGLYTVTVNCEYIRRDKCEVCVHFGAICMDSVRMNVIMTRCTVQQWTMWLAPGIALVTAAEVS